MGHTILAIVRFPLGAELKLKCGSLVRTYYSLLDCRDATRRFLCISPRKPEVTHLVPAGALLPMRYFLAREPLPEFWALIHRDRMLEGEDYFVRDPRALLMGKRPHRFESEGECLHYMNLYDLSSQVFLMAHVKRPSMEMRHLL